MKKDYNNDIPVLHGFRAIFILLVAHFHIWQQSWFTPTINLFGKKISLDFLARPGYVFVDGMILISAILMFLPYARFLLLGTEYPNLKQYYIKRVARIMPSYYFSVFFILFFFALPQDRFMGITSDMVKDIVYHIFFIQTIDFYTYIATRLNVALWTVAILMWAYLLMPFVIRAFIKKPIITSVIMISIAFAYRIYVINSDNVPMLLNQLPAFLDVYVLGFIVSYILVYIQKKYSEQEFKLWKKILSSIVFLITCFVLFKLLCYQAYANILNENLVLQVVQLKTRPYFAVAFAILILSASLSIKPIVFLLSNSLVRFLATISFNMYIWHQFIAVELLRAYFNVEQLHNDSRLEIAFTLLSWSVALIVAAFCTYYVEKPMSKLILNKFTRRTK